MTPGSQGEAAQHAFAALAYSCLDMHRRQAKRGQTRYCREELKHSGLAISLLKDEVTSGMPPADIRSTIIAIAFLIFVAVSDSLAANLIHLNANWNQALPRR
jgi:hypothetical protein